MLPSRAPSSPNSSITNSDWSAGLLCPGGRRRGSPGITWNPAALLARKGKRGLIGVLSDFSSVLRSVYSRTYSSTDRMGGISCYSCRSPLLEWKRRCAVEGACSSRSARPFQVATSYWTVVTTSDYLWSTNELFQVESAPKSQKSHYCGGLSLIPPPLSRRSLLQSELSMYVVMI